MTPWRSRWTNGSKRGRAAFLVARVAVDQGDLPRRLEERQGGVDRADRFEAAVAADHDALEAEIPVPLRGQDQARHAAGEDRFAEDVEQTGCRHHIALDHCQVVPRAEPAQGSGDAGPGDEPVGVAHIGLARQGGEGRVLVGGFDLRCEQQAEHAGFAAAFAAGEFPQRGVHEAAGQVGVPARGDGDAGDRGGAPRVGRGHQREDIAGARRARRRFDACHGGVAGPDRLKDRGCG
ncbi:hypothetical protein [Rhodanobacter lindaniclasticus]